MDDVKSRNSHEIVLPSFQRNDTVLKIYANDSHVDWTVTAYCKELQIKACKRIFDEVFRFFCEQPQSPCHQAHYCIKQYRLFHQSYINFNYNNGKLDGDNNVFSLENLYRLELVVLISHFEEDLSWLKEVSSSTHYIIASKTLSHQVLHVQKNTGNEVSSYLTYIVKYYDYLPKFTLFLHGHDLDWHQFYRIGFILNHLNLSYGYQNINNIAFSPSWRDSKMPGLQSIWQRLFQDELGDMPAVFHDRCCAQFVVHRNRIRLHSKQFYMTLLDYVYEGDTLSSDGYHSEMSFYMEYIWHYIFGEEAVTKDDSLSENYASYRVDADHQFGTISYYL